MFERFHLCYMTNLFFEGHTHTKYILGNETVENICIARKLDCINEPVLQ